MGTRRGPGGSFLQGLLVYLMKRVMISPSKKPAVMVLLFQIALIVGALIDCKSMGLGAIAPPSGEDRYVEAPTIPRNHPTGLKSIAIVWVMCAIDVWSVKMKHGRESVAFIIFCYLSAQMEIRLSPWNRRFKI
jgi:hypothetical protein